MKKVIESFWVFILLLTFAALDGAAAQNLYYSENDGVNGGTIGGIISLQGTVPSPVEVDLKREKNSEFCIEHSGGDNKGILRIHHVEAKKGKLKDAVIFIENIYKGKPWKMNAVNIDFKNCKAGPKVFVIRKYPRGITKGFLTIKNHDEGVFHNPNGYSIGKSTRRPFFKKLLVNKGSQVDVTKSLKHLKKSRDKHFYIECEQHLWMTVSARVLWNPYYAISDEAGSFQIENIPPGNYKLIAWHPYIGETSQEITITPGIQSKVHFTLGGL